jgi:RimJ/RimL family protein N-acetyltransferase
MSIARGERIALRPFTVADAPWVLELLTDPDFIRHVADRGVRTVPDAERYLSDGPLASYATHGCGLWAATLAADGTPVGMSGILVRDTLPAPDLGYAILPAFRGQGVAAEAARLALAHGHEVLGKPRILAIVSPHNTASRRVLARLGFRHESMHLPPGATEEAELHAHP